MLAFSLTKSISKSYSYLAHHIFFINFLYTILDIPSSFGHRSCLRIQTSYPSSFLCQLLISYTNITVNILQIKLIQVCRISFRRTLSYQLLLTLISSAHNSLTYSKQFVSSKQQALVLVLDCMLLLVQPLLALLIPTFIHRMLIKGRRILGIKPHRQTPL